jgi:ABC-2 type transport system ATP-binding protein
LSMNAIEVQALTKHFRSFTAVDHISFEVNKGEIFGFLGPNGSGKSTTIRMLTGVIRPDEGKAIIMGHDVQKEPLKAKQVMGIVPETSNAYIELSAWNNLMLMGELYGVSKKQRDERAERLLKQFGLYERRDSPARGFSKGMKQRLILCMALINEPSVLFLDEPTSGLDVESTRLINDVIRDLNKAGTTVFLTTHDMAEANQLCERIAIINHGAIAAIDRPEVLKQMVSGRQSVEVSFQRTVDTGDLSAFARVKRVEKRGDKLRLYTEDVNETIDSITGFANAQGLKIVSLNTLAPSLEDIFVELTQKERPEADHVLA